MHGHTRLLVPACLQGILEAVDREAIKKGIKGKVRTAEWAPAFWTVHVPRVPPPPCAVL